MSDGDPLEGLPGLDSGGRVEGLPEGVGGVEVEFMDQLAGIVAKHFVGDPAGGFAPETGQLGAEGDEFGPAGFKAGIIGRGFDEDNKFVHHKIGLA